jgi:DNA-directed RNA polymerase specialized sigma24 family protein
LILGLKARDERAWRPLASLYTPLVYRWCLQCRLRPQDAEDVVQEVFSTVLKACLSADTTDRACSGSVLVN